VRDNVELMLIGIVVLSVIPIMVEAVRSRRSSRRPAGTSR
jgi:hypothetical protein